MPRLSNSAQTVFATRADVVRLLGEIDDIGIAAVLELTPTVLEIEQAAEWLDAHDPPAEHRGRPSTPRVAQIVEIADRNDEEPSDLR